MRLRQPLAHKSLQLCYCQHLAAHSGACVFPINVVFVFYLTQKDESVLFFRCVLIRGWHPASRWLPFADSPVGSEMAHSKSLLHSLHLATFALQELWVAVWHCWKVWRTLSARNLVKWHQKKKAHFYKLNVFCVTAGAETEKIFWLRLVSPDCEWSEWSAPFIAIRAFWCILNFLEKVNFVHLSFIW